MYLIDRTEKLNFHLWEFKTDNFCNLINTLWILMMPMIKLENKIAYFKFQSSAANELKSIFLQFNKLWAS